MIASLPMYDLPPLQQANDRLWQAIRAALCWGPPRLDRFIGVWEAWRSPVLVLSQTCSLPYRTALHGQVALVGSPDFGLPGCAPGQYNSVLVAREDDNRPPAVLLAARVAVNERLSQSGYAALWQAAQAHGARPSEVVLTGAHAASVKAVAEGRADIAAIDAQTWRLLSLYDPGAQCLREIERTQPTPAMPYITALRHDPAELLAAMRQAVDALDAPTRMRLGLRGVVPVQPMDFLALETPPPLSQRG
ncbi:phosphate/phosphite/phosphonate ABC transporter substrate-binding protein [Thetidibacter halocola]|uniref:PhnD/SsuA/transferrin family substrate-binding protein n=1 Tax=Thetidibacter halocola TaxID=2827239 RepID=A0A8J8B720_9RHOB|nr:PhnD/SsuA/transferrin family substrate-binding protein [Thetidibacter halocola]MBS0123229.1 PhnD/SsuA/transferrin family substrate-binding protein [Thetidibacter halocola]